MSRVKYMLRICDLMGEYIDIFCSKKTEMMNVQRRGIIYVAKCDVLIVNIMYGRELQRT